MARGWEVSPMSVCRRWGRVPLSCPQAVWRPSLPGAGNFQDPGLLLEQLLSRECPHSCLQSLQGPLRLCTLGGQHPVGTLSLCPCRWSPWFFCLSSVSQGWRQVVTSKRTKQDSLVSGSSPAQGSKDRMPEQRLQAQGPPLDKKEPGNMKVTWRKSRGEGRGEVSSTQKLSLTLPRGSWGPLRFHQHSYSHFIHQHWNS